MVQTLERPEMRTEDLLERREVRTAPTRLPETEEHAPRRPTRWLRWMAAGALVLAGGWIAVLTIDSGSEPESVVPRTADGTEHWLESLEPESVVPRTADGTEGWLASLEPATATVPRSADGLAGWIANLDPKVPRTADGTEGWLTSVAMRAVAVPQTADGTEGWLDSLDESAPVVVSYLPVTPLVPVTDGWELTYLPVSQPVISQAGAQIVLHVQPIIVPSA